LKFLTTLPLPSTAYR